MSELNTLHGTIKVANEYYFYSSYGIDTLKFIATINREIPDATDSTYTCVNSENLFTNIHDIVFSDSLLATIRDYGMLSDLVKNQKIYGHPFETIVDVKSFIEYYKGATLIIEASLTSCIRSEYHCNKLVVLQIN